MKKLMSIISMLLLALTATTLVSCDDDSDIATTLEGTWQGKMELITEYQGQSYQVISSEICFVQDPYSYSSGTGYWIDYYQRSPWRNNQVARWLITFSGQCPMVSSMCTSWRSAHLWRFATIAYTMVISGVLSTMVIRLLTSVFVRCLHPTGIATLIGAMIMMMTIITMAMPRKMLSALVLRQIAQQSR